MSACPCGSGRDYAACCGRWHSGEAAPTAEALMRSRYSAYVMGDAAYLRATWHPSTCPADLELDTALRWLGLEVRRCAGGGEGDATGSVEFIARYKHNGRAGRLHEVSRFRCEAGHWFYLDGEIIERPAKKIR